MHIIQLALRLHKTPDEIENMSARNFNRLLLYLEAEGMKL